MEAPDNLENVYLRQEAAASFKNFAQYDPRLFKKTATCLIEAGLFRSKPYSILDLGTGSGDFVLPLSTELIKAGFDVTRLGHR